MLHKFVFITNENYKMAAIKIIAHHSKIKILSASPLLKQPIFSKQKSDCAFIFHHMLCYVQCLSNIQKDRLGIKYLDVDSQISIKLESSSKIQKHQIKT